MTPTSNLALKPAEAVPTEGPPKLATLADTGLGEAFLQNLALKIMYASACETPTEVAEEIKLPVALARELLERLRDRGFLEALGSESGLQSDLRYAMSRAGKDWTLEAMRQSEYVGPAPVSLAAYRAQIERQRITNDRVDRESVARSLSGLVLRPELIARLGPAVNAGRGILLYGAPGDGKTSIAMAIAGSFRQSILLPYAIEIDREVIKVFDPAVHRPLASPEIAGEEARRSSLRSRSSAEDRRWVRCERPVAVIGGELTLDMLDLKYNDVSRFYEAPLHIKVTGGVFVIDDFGRQIARPEQVLNRWILPLESRIDYLTLHTGKKFALPFDGVVIFSTNLTPKSIMDAAMVRRIPYNFHIAPPTVDEYLEIFSRTCAKAGLSFEVPVVEAVMRRLYAEEKLPLARFHPRFIVEHVLARCAYEGRTPVFDRELALEAAAHLYTER